MDFATIEYSPTYDNQLSYQAPLSAEPAFGGGSGSGGSRAAAASATGHHGGDLPPQALQQLRRTGASQAQQAYGLEQREASRFALSRGSGNQKYRKGLLGLSNLGNTCFMNAALQCLTHTHGLQKYFRFCSHAYTSKGQSNRQKLLMSFAHWFERDWGKSVSAHYHSPEDILRSVQQLNPIFQGYAQQDSQEFLRCVLDNIHEELRREVPDDLRAHLLECFGLEACPGDCERGSSSTGAADGSGLADAGAPPRPCGGGNDALGESPSSGSRAKPPSAASSATRQFMQLCHTTEGATDVGEIRLPAKLASQQLAFGCAGPSGGGAVASGAWRCEEPSAHGSSAASSGMLSSSSSTPGARSTHFSSIISELFQGHVVSTVRCLECQRTSRTKEPIYDVSVQIPNPSELGNGQAPLGDLPQQPMVGRGPSWTGVLGNVTGKVKGWFYDKGVEVTDCLRKFCAAESLMGKDKYDCEYCKRKTDGERRFAFKDLPEVLCIHIKRFRYDASWFNATKNSRVVTFPVIKPLDMSPFLDEIPGHPVEYRLVGLIQHIGSMGGGHYISYCQHKRRPQEWYEFDDLQVSMVNPEQVERAEPYVLFYQRIPSKGTKLDRQTVKSDMRRMDMQIRSLPADPDVVFLSKHWYVRLTTMSQPGPLDNYEYLCPHQLLGCYSREMAAEPFIPISRVLFQALVQKYGGGPAITALEVCSKCQTHLRAYNDRKQAEFDLVSKYDTKDTGDGKGWYLVDAIWVNRWKKYVRAEHVTDIRDMSAPGPVTNDRLFEKNNVIRNNLKLRVDYIGVNARVWWLFMHVHGGGPAICREDLDIYSGGQPLESELRPEELRHAGSTADFARRVSHCFVDGCKGDTELYGRSFGRGQGDAEMADGPEEDPAQGSPCPAPQRPRLRLRVAEVDAAQQCCDPREPAVVAAAAKAAGGEVDDRGRWDAQSEALETGAGGDHAPPGTR